MGVDSNVLIFERIREELAANKGARQAVAAGFDRVFITIVDTHLTSLIAAAFLFNFGTGPIRGFATTLMLGLLSNVFTAVFVSRDLFELQLSRKLAGARAEHLTAEQGHAHLYEPELQLHQVALARAGLLGAHHRRRDRDDDRAGRAAARRRLRRAARSWSSSSRSRPARNRCGGRSARSRMTR